MSVRLVRPLFALLIASLGLGSGCGSDVPATTENKLHDVKSFSSSELNAPLSPQAKAKGAQVAGPPTR